MKKPRIEIYRCQGYPHKAFAVWSMVEDLCTLLIENSYEQEFGTDWEAEQLCKRPYRVFDSHMSSKDLARDGWELVPSEECGT